MAAQARRSNAPAGRAAGKLGGTGGGPRSHPSQPQTAPRATTSSFMDELQSVAVAYLANARAKKREFPTNWLAHGCGPGRDVPKVRSILSELAIEVEDTQADDDDVLAVRMPKKALFFKRWKAFCHKSKQEAPDVLPRNPVVDESNVANVERKTSGAVSVDEKQEDDQDSNQNELHEPVPQTVNSHADQKAPDQPQHGSIVGEFLSRFPSATHITAADLLQPVWPTHALGPTTVQLFERPSPDAPLAPCLLVHDNEPSSAVLAKLREDEKEKCEIAARCALANAAPLHSTVALRDAIKAQLANDALFFQAELEVKLATERNLCLHPQFLRNMIRTTRLRHFFACARTELPATLASLKKQGRPSPVPSGQWTRAMGAVEDEALGLFGAWVDLGDLSTQCGYHSFAHDDPFVHYLDRLLTHLPNPADSCALRLATVGSYMRAHDRPIQLLQHVVVLAHTYWPVSLHPTLVPWLALLEQKLQHKVEFSQQAADLALAWFSSLADDDGDALLHKLVRELIELTSAQRRQAQHYREVFNHLDYLMREKYVYKGYIDSNDIEKCVGGLLIDRLTRAVVTPVLSSSSAAGAEEWQYFAMFVSPSLPADHALADYAGKFIWLPPVRNGKYRWKQAKCVATLPLRKNREFRRALDENPDVVLLVPVEAINLTFWKNKRRSRKGVFFDWNAAYGGPDNRRYAEHVLWKDGDMGGYFGHCDEKAIMESCGLVFPSAKRSKLFVYNHESQHTLQWNKKHLVEAVASLLELGGQGTTFLAGVLRHAVVSPQKALALPVSPALLPWATDFSASPVAFESQRVYDSAGTRAYGLPDTLVVLVYNEERKQHEPYWFPLDQSDVDNFSIVAIEMDGKQVDMNYAFRPLIPVVEESKDAKTGKVHCKYSMRRNPLFVAWADEDAARPFMGGSDSAADDDTAQHGANSAIIDLTGATLTYSFKQDEFVIGQDAPHTRIVQCTAQLTGTNKLLLGNRDGLADTVDEYRRTVRRTYLNLKDMCMEQKLAVYPRSSKKKRRKKKNKKKTKPKEEPLNVQPRKLSLSPTSPCKDIHRYLHGVGQKTSCKLAAAGLHTAQDLASLTPDEAKEHGFENVYNRCVSQMAALSLSTPHHRSPPSSPSSRTTIRKQLWAEFDAVADTNGSTASGKTSSSSPSPPHVYAIRELYVESAAAFYPLLMHGALRHARFVNFDTYRATSLWVICTGQRFSTEMRGG